MITWLLIGLLFTFLSYQYPISANISIDVLPAFIGFLLFWYIGNKREDKSKWFKEFSVTSVIFAFLHFIGFASSFQALLPQNTTFADSDILRFIFSGVNFVYEGGHLIFTGLLFISLHLLCRALGSIAEDSDKNKTALVFYIFTWIFLALTLLYIVANFIVLPFSVLYISAPIVIIFAVFSAVFMKRNDLD